VGRPSLAGAGDEPEAAAGQRGEGLGVVGRSWHGSRLQDRRVPSTACWRVLSWLLRSGTSSRQRAPVGLSSPWWYDQRNDRPSLLADVDTARQQLRRHPGELNTDEPTPVEAEAGAVTVAERGAPRLVVGVWQAGH
jgi:hypothetical protein